jgi:hypothetical protein
MAAPQLIRILANTDISDPAVWDLYEKPVPYVWRAPDPTVKRYPYGPITRQRISASMKKISYGMRSTPANAQKAADFWKPKIVEPETPSGGIVPSATNLVPSSGVTNLQFRMTYTERSDI